jgi:hypothetical protein
VFRRSVALTVAGVMTVALMFTGSASAATLVGSSCSANEAEVNVGVISLKNPPGYSLPSAIPSMGVITSWTFSLGLPIGTGGVQLNEQLKVFAPTGVPDQFTVVGESARSPVGVGSTTSPTRIPVQSGDLLGSSLFATEGSASVLGALFCKTENPGDEAAFFAGDPAIGSTVSALGDEPEVQNPVTVNVEPDADGDGYGDETQDQCPTDASTQGPCPAPKVAPAPPAPITLSASAAAKKGFVTVTLTDNAQATVTVGGSVTLGKGKSARLPGSTQIVAPGSLAKFTIPFPAKLKAELKRLPSNKKLSLSITASAPGATTTMLTVKIAGQKRVRPHHHGK